MFLLVRGQLHPDMPGITLWCIVTMMQKTIVIVVVVKAMLRTVTDLKLLYHMLVWNFLRSLSFIPYKVCWLGSLWGHLRHDYDYYLTSLLEFILCVRVVTLPYIIMPFTPQTNLQGSLFSCWTNTNLQISVALHKKLWCRVSWTFREALWHVVTQSFVALICDGTISMHAF